MTGIQAFFLGLLQGLTEFLPVSSSGHLELGKHFLGNISDENLTFTLVLHAGTVLSTIVVLRTEILDLFKSSITFRMNANNLFLLKLLFSAVPVVIIGLFFREKVENLFTGNLLVVGICLIVTATLLAFASYYRKLQTREIGWIDSLIIGVAQAIAILPGLSRSGSTIATGILLGNDRNKVTRFSFLMVLLPVLGAVLLDLGSINFRDGTGIGFSPLMIGFFTSFVTGFFACSWMIRIVSRGKLIYFSLYCLIIGLIAVFLA
jgi:undecaprenyl-diphosphatase